MTGCIVHAAKVHETLARHILADGMKIVFDYDRSQGSTLVDKVTGREYLDFFSFFASQPIGYNHPLTHEPEYEARLAKVARFKPTTSDIYTEEYASFVSTFADWAMGNAFRYAFFVAGGALGVENALKAAFDWKVRKNLARGRGERGSEIIHFEHAFHGRSGYTLSLTNTFDPRKHMYFPKFPWPRIPSPALRFPVTEEVEREVGLVEEQTIEMAERVFQERADDIAALIIEPIQSEGGDRHFRNSFLQRLRELCDTYEAMLIFDEVQTGCGLTGTFWYHEQCGVRPDLVTFGKKLQVCGVISTERIDEVKDNVFHLASRINSTFGPDVVDMVRSQRNLEIIGAGGLLENVKERGNELLAGLHDLERRLPCVGNARGKGLLCAIDLDTIERRNRVIKEAFARQLLVLPCGATSVRTRPFLDVTAADVARCVAILEDAIRSTV